MDVSTFTVLLDRLGCAYKDLHARRVELMIQVNTLKQALISGNVASDSEMKISSPAYDGKSLMNGVEFLDIPDDEHMIQAPIPRSPCRSPGSPRRSPRDELRPQTPREMWDEHAEGRASSITIESSKCRDEDEWSQTACGELPIQLQTTRQTTGGSTAGGQSPGRKASHSKIFNHECFVLWDVWTADRPRPYDNDSVSTATGRMSNGLKKEATFTLDLGVVRIGDIVRGDACCQSLIVKPSSMSRLLWDIFSICFMGYDILLIPMMVFDLPDSNVLDVMRYVTTVFWTLDMVFSLFVGYHTDGVIEMRPTKIIPRYLRTWFVLDALVVTSDWLSLSSSGSSKNGFGVVRLGKGLRLARILRIIRFLRVMKVVSLISEFSDYVHSESIVVLLSVCKFIVFILLVNHYIACGWYAVGAYHPESFSTWIDLLKHDTEHSIAYEYFTALHWSFTQFTPASMEVHPHNSLERIYAIIILLLALIVFSSFVSGITAAVTTLRQMNIERTRQQEMVRRYITDKKISLDLGNRILSFIRKQRFVKRTVVIEADVAAFKRLPDTLMVDLHAEVYLPIVARHPCFHHLLVGDQAGLIEICHESVSEKTFSKSMIVFSRGQEGTKMSFVVMGSLRYLQGAKEKDFIRVREGAFLSEAVLWIRWMHQGILEASNICEIVECHAAEFHAVVQRTLSYNSCRRYASDFASRILAEFPDVAPGISRRSSPSLPMNERSNTQSTSLRTPNDTWGGFDLAQEIAQIAFEGQLQLTASGSTEFQAIPGSGEGIRAKFGKLRSKFNLSGLLQLRRPLPAPQCNSFLSRISHRHVRSSTASAA